MKATGTLAGVSDLIVTHNRTCYYVEVKDHRGVQSDAQIEFACRIVDQGFNYFLVRSLAEFQALPILPQPNNELNP